jgi:hypothetical protein
VPAIAKGLEGGLKWGNMPFLTLEDPNAKIKGSRDPLGIVPVWSSFCRQVVRNLTTQSTSVRGFTTLLLARYLTQRLIDEGEVPAAEALNVFLRMEQIAAYARHVGHGTEARLSYGGARLNSIAY